MKKEASKKHTHKDSAPDKIAEPITVDRRSRTDRKDEGKSMRLAVPLASHAQWQAPANRRDPITQSFLYCRVKFFQFYPRVLIGKSPFHRLSNSISLFLPCGDFHP